MGGGGEALKKEAIIQVAAQRELLMVYIYNDLNKQKTASLLVSESPAV